MAGIEGEPNLIKEKKKYGFLDRMLDSFTNSELKNIKTELKMNSSNNLFYNINLFIKLYQFKLRVWQERR